MSREKYANPVDFSQDRKEQSPSHVASYQLKIAIWIFALKTFKKILPYWRFHVSLNPCQTSRKRWLGLVLLFPMVSEPDLEPPMVWIGSNQSGFPFPPMVGIGSN